MDQTMGMLPKEPGDDECLVRCFPQTYEYYRKSRLSRFYAHDKWDPFDRYVVEQVPLLTFLVEQYYKLSKHPKLQLSCLCSDEATLHTMDTEILKYIRNKADISAQAAIRKCYVSIIERALVDMVRLIDDQRRM